MGAGAYVAAFGALALLMACASWSQEVPPANAPPAEGQQPGQGAQVHTGTTSGLTIDARLQGMLADHQYARVAKELDQLPSEEAKLYRGVLANRSNDLKTSIELLEPIVEQVAASGDIAKEKLVRKTVAEDYLRLGELGEAAAAFAALETSLGSKLSEDEQDALELPLKLLPLAKDNPPMTVEPCDPFTLQYDHDPIGLMDVPVFVDARPRSWILDPTAPFNLIDRATAVEAGLKISEQTATIHTLTGNSMQVRMALIPRFTIGGRLTFHDMTVFVFDDADYDFPLSKYQVEGVLGYPALSALGGITVTDHSTIEVRPAKGTDGAKQADLLTSGALFYLDGEQIIVGLGNAAGDDKPGEERMFAVDAGGQESYLTSRFFDEHAAEFNKQKLEEFSLAGQPSQPSYTAETVRLRVGQTPIELHYLPVLTQPIGSAALDDVYGILGVDALGQFRSFTFDYRTMRFSVETGE